MWLTFFTGVIVCAGILFVPGFLLLRALGCPKFLAVACAPCVSIFEHVAVGAIFGLPGIAVPWWGIVLPGIVLGLLVLLLKHNCAKFRKVCSIWETSTDISWKALLLFTAVAVVLTFYMFIIPLDGPESIVQEFDNASHLNRIFVFMITGRYSTLQATIEPSLPLQPFGDISFYPSAWHVIAALSANAVGASAAMAENIANTVFLGLVYPTAICAYLSFVFKLNKRLLICAALLFMGFSAFPWGFLVAGPLYSNFAAMVLLPASMALVHSFSETLPSRSALIPGLLVCVSVLSVAFAQPNAVFTGAVLLLPYLFSQIDRWYTGSHIWRVRLAFGFLGVLFWIILRELPLFRDVVANDWSPYVNGNEFQALFDYVSLGFRNSVAQPELAVLVLVGAAYVIAKRKGSLFLPAYCFFAIPYFVVAMYGPGNPTGSFFSGFWYNDADRIAACGAMAALPLACFGLYGLVCFAEKAVEIAWDSRDTHLAPIAICTVAFILIFMPNHIFPGRGEVRTALGDRRVRLDALATYVGSLTKEELAFLEECKGVVGDEEVLNNPYDGSAFAYAYTGLDVYFKSFWSINNSIGSNMPVWRVTRWLYLVDDHGSVRDAVDALGIRYVLVLDSAQSDEPTMYEFFTYKEGQWQGIMNITDETPGFEVVLAEGDMRLYRIVD